MRTPSADRAILRRFVLFGAATGSASLCLTLVVWALARLFAGGGGVDIGHITCPDWIEQQFIDVDGAARSGAPLAAVRDIAVHYVGNPGSTAINNRHYFNRPGVAVSSHFVVGLEGEVIQCLPLNEKSAATNHRNIDTISIEVCHPDESGQFNEKTYAALIRLCAWLCGQFGLDESHLIRHYDVTGKECPRYYVRNEQAWAVLRQDVGAQLAVDRSKHQSQRAGADEQAADD